ncbi:MAG: M23 family metallopeptidase, partial [Myxococcota bacterium]
QGKTWALWVRSDEPLVDPTATVTVIDAKPTEPSVQKTFALHAFGTPGSNVWRGLRGIEIQEPTGPHPLVITAKDALGNEARLERTFEVAQTAFAEGGYIKLSKKQVAARKDEEAIAKMRAERDAAYAHPQPVQRWSGPFAKPIPGAELTSPFGKYRSYSDGRKSYHSGLDLSEPRGTPVRAAAPGVVLVAHEQAIFGNVVIVNHGLGVATSYNHLDRIDVREGDQVEAGQQLGALGSTGQSTGPHLHWGLEVDVVAVDPGEWLSTGFDVSPFAPAPLPTTAPTTATTTTGQAALPADGAAEAPAPPVSPAERAEAAPGAVDPAASAGQ